MPFPESVALGPSKQLSMQMSGPLQNQLKKQLVSAQCVAQLTDPTRVHPGMDLTLFGQE